MAWKIKVLKRAEKALHKLDRQIAERIITELEEISQLDNPKSRGKALVGNLSGLWRYRVNDYRIICSIESEEIVIAVIDIGHRSKIYA
ncbi:type II toxin-antitoxin system RelE/ParE family toxin [Alloscardovia theropitheci]|uniref:Type II toxin-antitoxin system RelE/ParE family toxin n=1 Tax=Alloscardovia theropitheci TaxID=2496842 RepID=A0A4V2MTY9_9BIFI|nr:type II toxin-antitoxin system RelE/ParE family toxin [Alloscardovia theropitheci]TCD54339.1 type II toxin-antitoxin system RelE/ParE family toxin [Alloscardovia theropitheci]